MLADRAARGDELLEEEEVDAGRETLPMVLDFCSDNPFIVLQFDCQHRVFFSGWATAYAQEWLVLFGEHGHGVQRVVDRELTATLVCLELNL